MRRPALHRPTPSTGLDIAWSAASDIAWAHPYTGRIDAAATFYNDGGTPTPPVAPAPVVETPKPGPPPAVNGTFTQEDLDRIAAREKAQGARSGAREALEKFAADNGFSSIDDAKAFIEAGRTAQQAQLTEAERRQQELDQREQQIAQREAAAAVTQREAARRIVLVGLGAIDTQDKPNLQDATALLEHALRDQPDADTDAIAAAAAALKTRRPELFGTPAPASAAVLPPAPGGAPAGGGNPARPVATREDVQATARKRAEQMGFRRPAA